MILLTHSCLTHGSACYLQMFSLLVFQIIIIIKKHNRNGVFKKYKSTGRYMVYLEDINEVLGRIMFTNRYLAKNHAVSDAVIKKLRFLLSEMI